MEATQVRDLIVIITTTGTERHRYWVIEIQYIDCDLLLKGSQLLLKIYQLICNQNFQSIAPSGCLQYYSGVTGLVKTMNFDCDTYFRNGNVERECLMAGLEYNICVRIEAQRCAIQWSAEHFDVGPSGVIGSQRGDCI